MLLRFDLANGHRQRTLGNGRPQGDEMAALQPTAPVTLHERVLAMMPAMDGGLFMATAEGVVRIDPATGGWRDTGLKGRLHELMGTSAPSGPVWGGREPGQPVANDYPSDWGSCWPVLQPH